jgi:hypothetical protein
MMETTADSFLEKMLGNEQGPREWIHMPCPKPLGELLLEKNIITQSQLNLALARKKRESRKYLGQIFIEMGINQSKINQILDSFGKRRPIGQTLIDMGMITPPQLASVLQKQQELKRKGNRKLLGFLLLKLGYINQDDYMKALAKHYNMFIVFLGNFFLSELNQRVIGEKFARKNHIVVLENDWSRLRLAMADPSPLLLDELRGSFHPDKNVEFFLAYPAEIEACFRKKFDPFSLSHYK